MHCLSIQIHFSQTMIIQYSIWIYGESQFKHSVPTWRLLVLVSIISHIYFCFVGFYQQLVIHSWLLLSRILGISNFATSRAIYPLFLLVIQHLIEAKSYRYLESRYLEFSGPLNNFLLLSRNFLKISKAFKNFSSRISLFKHPLVQLLHLCRQE